VDGSVVVGWTLIAGFVLFLVGAAAWRLAYEQDLPEALRVIQADRRRRAWIHRWMIPAVVTSAAGLVGFVGVLDDGTARVVASIGVAVYVIGAVCWIASLAFGLTVVPWAADQLVATDRVPEAFPALDAWAGSLYVIHMATSYAAFVVVGAATLAVDMLPVWVGWTGIGAGGVLGAGFAVTRASGPFNPPLWAHTYTAVVGVALLLA
jgi:hypothetical protein